MDILHFDLWNSLGLSASLMDNLCYDRFLGFACDLDTLGSLVALKQVFIYDRPVDVKHGLTEELYRRS